MPLALGVNTTAIGSLGVTGASGYSLSLVQFTGGDTYLSRGANLTGLGDSGSFTMSVWLRFDNADEDGSTRGIFANEQTTGDFLIRAIGTNFLQGIAYGPTVQVIARNSVAANYQTSSGLFHLLCARLIGHQTTSSTGLTGRMIVISDGITERKTWTLVLHLTGG